MTKNLVDRVIRAFVRGFRQSLVRSLSFSVLGPLAGPILSKPLGLVAKQILGRRGSSRILGENLELMGVIRPANSDAHHIVAWDARRAAPAKRVLKREGIDINEAANGVFLPSNLKVAAPSAKTHRPLHTKEYYEEVNRRLEGAAPGTVRDVLGNIAYQLRNGTFPH